MRILRIADIADNRTGGMSRVIYCSGDALEKRGHRVEYMLGPILGDVRPTKLRRFIVPVRAANLAEERHRANGCFDVIEIHEPSAAPYVFRRRRDHRIPPCVALTFGVEARGHRARSAYRQTLGLSVTLKERLSPWSVIAQANFALKYADHIICFNSEDHDYLIGRGRRPNEVTRTHSGIDTAFLWAGKESRPSAAPKLRLLFLGTWIERKGVRDLAAAIPKLFAFCSTTSLTIAGCGCPPETVLADFPTICHSRINITPFVRTDHELIELFRHHDVFVLPSYFEGQPLAMLEAAAMGLAIVTTNVCGMADFVVDGTDGLLVPPGKPDALIRAITKLTTQTDLARCLGEAARRKVHEYTWDAVAIDFEKAYEAACRRRV